MSNKILIIAYPFPPIPYSGTYRIVRMCKGLTRLGIEVHVLTIHIDNRIPNDFELLSKIPESVKLHRSKILDPWLRYRQWRKKREELNLHGYVDKLISAFMRLITIPDHQIFWIPSVIQRGRNIIRKYNISNIMVTSPPVSTLSGGMLLKKMTGVRLLADLRDPIVGNIAQVNLINPSDIFSRFEKRLLEKIERLVIKNADVVIANTETHRKELKKKYDHGNIRCIRNCFDEDEYKGITRRKYGKFTIAHVGSMYGLRKADLLFKALKTLATEVKPQPLNLRVLFVGSNDHHLHSAIEKHGVQRYVRVLGMVPHKSAIEMMTKAHLLLLIKATGNGSFGQIPAKFFEYLGTGNMILLIGPQESEVGEIIRSANCGYCIGNDEEKMFSVLKEEYLAFLQGDISRPYPLEMTNELSNSKMAENLFSLIS